MKILTTKNTAILGFGNQAKAWALNLNDSGLKLNTFHLRKGESYQKAIELNFKAQMLDEINDETILLNLFPEQLHEEVLSKLPQNKNLKIVYAHGFSIDYSRLHEKYPQFTHLLLAPKTIASELRFHYETKKPISAVYSTQYSNEKEIDQKIIFEISQLIGINVGPFETTFSNETKADLFSEQSLLCGLYPFAINEAYKILRENGVDKETSFLECYHESLLIMKAFIEHGPEKFFTMISPNALLGSYKAKEKILPSLIKNYQELMNDLNTKKFKSDIENASISTMRDELIQYFQTQEISKTLKDFQKLYEH